MKVNDLVSVIVTVFNIDKYIEKCINSLVIQTYENIEIIIIDDGSTDKSSQICDSVAKMDARIVVRHIRHEGVSNARNIGISCAKGEWICFVDGDDYVPKEMIGVLLECSIRENAEICVGDYSVHRSDKDIKQYSFVPYREIEDLNKIELFRYIMLGNGNRKSETILGVPWAKLFRTEFLNKNNLRFRVGLKRNQDMIFSLYAFQEAEKIAYCPRNTYFYRIWENSSVRKYTSDYLSVADCILSELNTFFNKYGVFEECRGLYYKRVCILFLECFDLTVLHTECRNNLRDKLFQTRLICESENVSIKQCPDSLLRGYQIVVKWFIKLQNYAGVYCLLKLRKYALKMRSLI